MNNYPNQPGPPYPNPGGNPPPGSYPPPSYGYDPGGYDYLPPPVRGGPPLSIILLVAGVALFCVCCGMLMGIFVGIELPGFFQSSPPPPTPEPTPEGLNFLLKLLHL